MLVYAGAPRAPQHEAARGWLDGLISDGTRVGMPWTSLLAFLRLVTNPRIFAPATSMEDAWLTVIDWLEPPNVWIPEPTERHADVLGPLLLGNPRGRHVTDAHLAALAIEHGLTLCSNDRDFARFDGLRWENPLD